MNFLNLEYFLIAAEELNFTKAAKRLYISQQSLSNHIAKLEAHFGLPLFDRTPPMTLTAAGLSLAKRARSLLNAKNETELELQDIKDFRSGYLSIGVTHARGTVILPMVLPPFHRSFPQVRLQLVEGTSQQLETALLNGNVDLTIGFRPSNATNVESEVLLDETSVLVVPHQILDKYFPTKSQMLRNTPAAPVQEILRRCPVVTISATTWAGAVLERYCRKTGITPRVVVETVNVATLVALCLEGMGVIVCPRIFLHKLNFQLNASKLQYVSIYSLDPELEQPVIALNYLKHKYLSQSAREFIRITKEVFRNEGLAYLKQPST